MKSLRALAWGLPLETEKWIMKFIMLHNKLYSKTHQDWLSADRSVSTASCLKHFWP
jgi:hypothetical protein